MASTREHDRIELTGSEAVLVVGNAVADRAQLADFERLCVAWMGDPLFHGDEPFYVLALPGRFWVIPEFTVQLQPLLVALVPRLVDEGRVVQAVADNVPVRWRARVWGLPMFPIPRLTRQAPETRPKWQEQPITREAVARATGVDL